MDEKELKLPLQMVDLYWVESKISNIDGYHHKDDNSAGWVRKSWFPNLFGLMPIDIWFSGSKWEINCSESKLNLNLKFFLHRTSCLFSNWSSCLFPNWKFQIFTDEDVSISVFGDYVDIRNMYRWISGRNSNDS